jgi:hypothetical protein
MLNDIVGTMIGIGFSLVLITPALLAIYIFAKIN